MLKDEPCPDCGSVKHQACEGAADLEEYGELCYECGGDMFIVADCFEDSCCCLDPEEEHGLIPCPLCNTKGPI